LSPLTEKKAGLRKRILRASIALAAAALLGGGGLLLVDRLSTPRLSRIEPVVVEPGGVLTLSGSHFGAERGESRVEIDGVAPTSSSYVSWAPGAISLRLPASAESGLIYVVTRHGRSNAKLFMNRARLPVKPTGDSAGRSGPFLASLSPEKGAVGSLLVLSGLNFGSNRERGEVLFSWSSDASSGGLPARNDGSFIASKDLDSGYEFWSDKEIRLRVPDGAQSGSIVVSTDSGKSNGLYFEVGPSPGTKRCSDRRSYSIDYSASVTKIRTTGPSELYLWVPKPAESSSQRIARVLSQDPAPFIPDYRGSSLYRFIGLSPNQSLTVTQSFLVQTWAVSTELNPDLIERPKNPPAAMSAYLAADPFVPSTQPEIQAAAKGIVKGEKNPWRAAKLVYDYLTKNIAWSPDGLLAAPSSGGYQSALSALSSKKADSYAYASLAVAILRAAGVPAIPVLGYLVNADRKAERHAWLEFYIYGLGWVPMDPILGSGARPGSFPPAFDDPERYFGNLDNRRIAFSRGYAAFPAMSPQGRHASPHRPYALMSFYEEASGALDAYSSFWSEIEVSGLY
jgi:transglutaminase-like putative cysteine protease